MTKIIFCLFILLSFCHSASASENAFSVLMGRGFKKADLVEAVTKYPELKDLEVADDLAPKGDSFKMYAENTDEVYLITKSDSGFDIEKSNIQFEMHVNTIDGEIRNTLSDTIQKETGSARLGTQMADAFKDDFSSMKGLRVRATYSFDVFEYFDNDRFVKYGSIIAGQVTIGRAISRKLLQINFDNYSWELLPENYSLADKPFYAPVRSSRVSSLFQLNRRHPVKKRHQPHNGIDFVATSGTAVYPALEGEIITISRTRSKGKYITILHDNGYQTTYMHLRKIQPDLHVGMRVALEDQIGEVGRTGYATGAHLHFGVIKDGYFVNPIHLLKSYCYDQKDQFENLDPEVDEQVIIDDEEAL